MWYPLLKTKSLDNANQEFHWLSHLSIRAIMPYSRNMVYIRVIFGGIFIFIFIRLSLVLCI